MTSLPQQRTHLDLAWRESPPVLIPYLDGDEGAAETGVTETTMKPIRYSHHTMTNVKIWDLLSEVKFKTYDFFIIISTVRFKENDIMLAKEIQKMKTSQSTREIGVMQAFFHKAFITFGLSEKSLRRLSERVNKPVGELSSAMKSRFAGRVDEKVVARMMHTAVMVAAKAIEAVLTTVVFSFAAIWTAFATTLHLLHEGIKEMAEDAKAVLMAAGLE
uniref:IRG-type G domain-containing protein n=1 Tax=Oncorhynchus tshawytscha TaxID=74940 RepID=A0AAZ3RKG9_ONCTS